MEHPKLLKIQALLPNYFSYFKSDNVLTLSEDKTSPPFAYLITNYEYPKEVLLSISVDYPTCINIADLVIKITKVSEIGLSEPFYISNSGMTHFNDDAYDQWSLDSIDLNSMEPISQQLN